MSARRRTPVPRPGAILMAGALALGATGPVLSCKMPLKDFRNPVDPAFIHVESIALDSSEEILAVGAARELGFTIAPREAMEQRVVWKSADESIARVDGSGKVRGVSVGKVAVTVTAQDGAKVASCDFTVVEHWVDVTGFGVASVDPLGIVTARAAGTVKIVATTAIGGYQAACSVTVDASPCKRASPVGLAGIRGLSPSSSGDTIVLVGTQPIPNGYSTIGIAALSTDRGKSWNRRSTGVSGFSGPIDASGDGSRLAAIGKPSADTAPRSSSRSTGARPGRSTTRRERGPGPTSRSRPTARPSPPA